MTWSGQSDVMNSEFVFFFLLLMMGRWLVAIKINGWCLSCHMSSVNGKTVRFNGD
jgi:hypothetical protein